MARYALAHPLSFIAPVAVKVPSPTMPPSTTFSFASFVPGMTTLTFRGGVCFTAERALEEPPEKSTTPITAAAMATESAASDAYTHFNAAPCRVLERERALLSRPPPRPARDATRRTRQGSSCSTTSVRSPRWLLRECRPCERNHGSSASLQP